MESTGGAVLDELINASPFPWDRVEVNSTSTTSEHVQTVAPNIDIKTGEVSGEQSHTTKKINDAKLAKPKSAARVRLIYGVDLNANPRFSNAIDGKKLEDSAMYFQVSPYAFARRSMMRTATVRTLLLERKLPRIVDAHDQLMVIVSMDWVTGKTSPQSLNDLGFNPEDYFDAE
jgi:hypothetical protein